MKKVRNILSLSLVFIMLISSVIFADTTITIPNVLNPISTPIKLPKVMIKTFEIKNSEEMPPLNLDGSQSEWAEDEILEAYKYGLTYDGVEGKFQNQITREEFATIAVKMYEKLSGKTATPAANPFTDTTNPEILKAYKIGIIKGTSATTFSPTNNISRQEICVMVQRALKESYPNLQLGYKGDFPFVDASNIATWAIEEVKYAYQHGIMKGTGNNTISPLDNTTREQAIALLKRTFVMGSTNGLPMEIDKSRLEAIGKNKIYPIMTAGALGKSEMIDVIKFAPHFDLIKFPLPIGLDSDKIETPGETPGFPLTIKDAELRGVGWLGKGVNIITDEYAKEVKQLHILDDKKLLEDGRIYYKLNTTSSSRYISGQDAWSYSKNLSTSIDTGGHYLCFGGSISTKFNSEHLQEKDRSFATLMYRSPQYDLYIGDLSVNHLKNYLADDFKKNLATMDAKQLFERYGTHMLRSVIMGGRVEYNATTDSQYQRTGSNMEIDVKASFNAAFASADIGVETSIKQASESFHKYSVDNIEASPSYGSIGLNPKDFDKWYQQMLKEPGMCDYGENPLIPIWELADGARSKELESEYHKYAESKISIPAQTTFGINGIRIERYGMFDHYPHTYVDQKTKDRWELVGNVRASSKYHPTPELSLVYVRKGYSNDIARPPIVGLIIANHEKGDNPLEMFDMAYGNDPDAKLWGPYSGNMEANSGLDFYVNSGVTLHYVTSKNEPQLIDLRVKHVCNCTGNINYYPANTTDDPDYLPVVNIYTNKPQMLSENESPRIGFQCVTLGHYLEYKQ